MPLRVFNLGTGSCSFLLLLLGGFGVGRQDHEEVAAFHQRLARDLDAVEALFVRDPLRGLQREHSQLVALIVDQAHLLCADLIVDAEFLKRDRALPLSVSELSSYLQYKKRGRQSPSALRTSSARESKPGGEGRALLQRGPMVARNRP